MIEKKQVSSGKEKADRFPDLFRLKDGRILLLYQELSPGRFHWKDCIIRLQVSEDEGRSWSKSRELFHFQDIDAIKIKKGIYLGDFTRFARLPDGRIVIVGGIRDKETGKSYAGWWESYDEGKTWKGPIIHHNIIANQITRPRVLKNGDIGFLASGSKIPIPHSPQGRRTYIRFIVSEDGGQSWHERSILFDGDYFPFGLCEPDWVVFPDGKIQVFTRADCGYTPGILFESYDNGYTWKKQLMPFLGHHLAADIIPGTEQVMICFRACHYTWMPAVGAWWNDGSKFGKFLHLHQGVGGGRYHSDVGQWLQLKDGRFLVSYSIKTEEKEEVHVWTASFSLDDFKNPF